MGHTRQAQSLEVLLRDTRPPGNVQAG